MIPLVIAVLVLELGIFAALVWWFRRSMFSAVASSTQHLEEMSRELSRKEEELKQKHEELKKAETGILNAARAEAERARDEIITRAADERDTMIAAARAQADIIVKQADKSRQQLIAEIGERVSREAAHKAGELIRGSLPESFKQAVHAQWLQELLDGGFSGIERLRFPDNETAVKVAAAFKLTDEQKLKISRKISAAAGRTMSLEESVDPALTAGVVITIGSLVLDGSLANKIREKTR